MQATIRIGRILSYSLVIGVLLAVTQVCVFATGSVTLAWIPSTDATVVGYNIYYGGVSGIYTNVISMADTTSTVVPGLVEGATYYFAATAYDSSGVESPFSNEASYTLPTILTNPVPVIITNNPPTLDVISNLTINQNSGSQTVNLSGINSNVADKTQPLIVTVISSNPALIPTPTVSYTSANTTGTLTLAPAPGAVGTATITVMVNNGQTQSNTFTRTFMVTVNAPNPSPTLNPITNLYLTENAGAQIVNLTGISSGAVIPNKKQTLKITAVSANSKLLSKPTVRYSVGSSGTMTFKPTRNVTGTTIITVTVKNGMKNNNTVQKTFVVTVLAASQATPATLTPATHVAGQFALTIAGSSGMNYIVQASTNLVNWVSVQTNAAPFTFTDTEAGQFNQRFYRSVSAP